MEDAGLGIKRMDHVSVATDDIEERVRFYQELFGMQIQARFENKEAGFKGAQLKVPGSDTGWEILAPAGENSFLERFLAERGPGVHHVTYEVEDAEKAAAALRAHGIEPFDQRISHGWHQMFIHPRDAGGVLIQLYQLVDKDAHEASSK